MTVDLWLIRHGQTQGNREGRYIGTTDEPLCDEGRSSLQVLQKQLPVLSEVWGSPLRRCRETAALLFPDASYEPLDQLRERAFGRYEGKNYQELAGDEPYQRWLDSGGALPFPDGEDQAEFQRRSVRGFCQAVEEMREKAVSQAALVVHGGTVMAVLSHWLGGSFYDWQVPNGAGYLLRIQLDNPPHIQLLGQLSGEEGTRA